MQLFIVPTLQADLYLDGLHHEIQRRWHVAEDAILLHTDHVNEAELAQALAKAVDVRSEEDFCDNLLRCSDDGQRKQKLQSKGISEAEVDRCLREFSGHPEDITEQPEILMEPMEEEPSPIPTVMSKGKIPQGRVLKLL